MQLKKLMAIALCAVLAFQAVPVYAGTFTDLKDSEWAEPFIEKMASKGIITGFNGQYKPAESVNKYSAIVMIYRMLKAAGKLDTAVVNAAVTKHSAVLTANSVPSWPDLHQAVAWSLENGVIQADELKYFMSGENHINARRYELAVFLGKALNVFLKENVNTFISLSFKDANLISSSSAPYVNLLVSKKVLQGDLEGNFKPYDPMNRAAMAKVLSVSYDLISGAVVPPATPTTPTAPVNDSVGKSGVISYVLSDSRKVIIAEKDDASKTEIYTVNSDAKIYINNSVSAFDDLKKNMEVSLTLTDGKVSKVVVGSLGTDLKGVLRKIEDMKGYYLVTVIDDADSKTKEFYTTNALKQGSKDGAVVELSKLMAGDAVKLTFNGANQITSIVASTGNDKIEGIMRSQSLLNGKPSVRVRTDANQEMDIELSTSLSVRRNDKYAELTELVPGDYVVVKTVNGKATVIQAYNSASKKVKGTIEQITIGRVNKVTVKDEVGDSREYEIIPSTSIRLDGKASDLYEMRLNYRVEIELQGSALRKVEATKVAYKDQVSGRVSKVYSDLNLITIKVASGVSDQYVSVTVNGNTSIITAGGATRSVGSLEEGKSVFISGNYYDAYFLAEKIIILD